MLEFVASVNEVLQTVDEKNNAEQNVVHIGMEEVMMSVLVLDHLRSIVTNLFDEKFNWGA